MAKKYLKIIETVNERFSPGDFDTKVVKLIADMQALVAKYGNGVYLDYDYEYSNYSSGEYAVRIEREESDEERNKRLADARKERALKKAAEAGKAEQRREMYEELKKEFE